MQRTGRRMARRSVATDLVMVKNRAKKSEPKRGGNPTPALPHTLIGAGMATDEIHLREGAEQSSATEFGRVAAAIDEAECIGGERVGGPAAARATPNHRL
jgi:hypothetical protein